MIETSFTRTFGIEAPVVWGDPAPYIERVHAAGALEEAKATLDRLVNGRDR